MTLSNSSELIGTDRLEKQLETNGHKTVSDQEMRNSIRTLLTELGEDPDREGLRDTPKRVSKAWQFLTSGYDQSLEELLNGLNLQ